MIDERRKTQRTPFVEDCSWQRAARVTDLSTRGCYVDSYRVPPLGEAVEFTVNIWGQEVPLRGVVVHATAGIGFAIEFTALDESALNRIASFVLSIAPARTTH
jgi:hypothetical protein